MTNLHKSSFVRILILTALVAAVAAAQSYHFDSSGNATLHGKYFVREVTFQSMDANGNIGQATSTVGIATFDGSGNYSFAGVFSDSINGTGMVSNSGTYAVAANGFLRIASFTMNGMTAFGGVAAVGPYAFTAGATESSSSIFDLMVAIPIGSSASNASLSGAYHAVYLNFPQAAIGQARQAYMPLLADGKGGFGAVTVSGTATDNAKLTTQSIAKVSYSLSGTMGTIDFGASGADQLISGAQSFFVSPDGNLLVGGSPTGYDLFLATPAVSSASNAMFQGFYYMGGLDADNSQWANQGLSMLEASYGSMNATGQGDYLCHLRLNSNGYPVEDLTTSWEYDMQSDGSFSPGYVGKEQYWLGGGGQVVLGVGMGNFYSVLAGLHAVNYTPAKPTSVFLNPLGIVNTASYAPATNSVAPFEMVTLFGSNLSSGTASATSFPLPTTLSNTSVVVNGVAAPLLMVTPTAITMMVPSIATPDFTAYAAFQVTNGSTASNMVTMYTNYTAPGVFALGENGMGPAAAENASYQIFGPNIPGTPGEMATLYMTGMGSVSPVLADGVESSPTGQPLNWLDLYADSAMFVYFGADSSQDIQYAGVAPGYAAGLYQVNAQIPAAAAVGNDYLDILTPDAETSQVTLNISGASGMMGMRRAFAMGRRGVRRQPAAQRTRPPVPR